MTCRRVVTAALVAGLGLLAAAPAAAQVAGAVAGRITNRTTGDAIPEALVTVDGTARGAVTDTAGRYRIREVPGGWRRLRVARIGFRPVVAESVFVRTGETITVDLSMEPVATELAPQVIEGQVDPILDPLVTATEQTITAEEFRRLPLSSLQEAIGLAAGNVEGSFRGGRIGQESFILDGLGLKNQLDASTGELGLRIPPALLTEASLVTNGFSARYGQALSGMINVVTRDGPDQWMGMATYETDRPFSGAGDLGLDRVILQAGGPLPGRLRFVGVIDAQARIDADPVNAPPPPDPRDPRNETPWLLPHNSGEQLDIGGKLTIPVASQHTVQLFALSSTSQRLLFDPAWKYDLDLAPGQRLTGFLATGHYQYFTQAAARIPVVADLRLGWFDRQFTRGQLVETPEPGFGAFTGERYEFVGEDIAKAQDTVAAREALPGFRPPDFSTNTPWGVPAFFYGTGSKGDLGWSRFQELRSQVDVTIGTGATTDLYVGGEYVGQRVRTFSRIEAALPTGGDVPPAEASDFSPTSAALYAEGQLRFSDIGVNAGIRYDQFDPGADLEGNLGPRRALNPRVGISTVLKGATFVASYGRFSQAPDFQFLVDGTFDDTTRTGRFRRGNPNLGFEDSHQFEFSLRMRPKPFVAVRLNAYYKRLEGLVSSAPLGTDPDSSIFGNGDYGNVRGGDIIVEREFREGIGVRVAYTLQYATATSSSPYVTLQLPEIDPATGDTIFPGEVDFPLDFDRRHALTAIVQSASPETWGPQIGNARPLAGIEAAAILRYASGLPFSRTNVTGDTLLGPPNSYRLPAQMSVDMLIRRPFAMGRARGSVYLDVRNLFNRQNQVSARRDTGTPELDEAGVQREAQAAYEANPQPIPYESARYRSWADTDGNGFIMGPEELLPLYTSAVRDFTQPLFAYGAPRILRVGMELGF